MLSRWRKGRAKSRERRGQLDRLVEDQQRLTELSARLLVQAEASEEHHGAELQALRGEITRVQPRLDELFALCDLLINLYQQFSTAGACVFTGAELSLATVEQLAAASQRTGPNDRAVQVQRVLAGALARLDRFLESQGVRRVGHPGQLLDGRALRVVEREEREEIPDGTILQVVRCGFVRGDAVVREGDVVVSGNRTSRQHAGTVSLAIPSAEARLGGNHGEDGVGH